MIDIGAPAIVRSSSVPATFTRISLLNPANGTGIITTVIMYVAIDMTNLRVGTFYLISGTDYKCRDSVALGNPLGGGVRTFPGLSIAVVIGDFIGCYADAGQLENDDLGGGAMKVFGEYIDPGDQATYSATTDIYSLEGTGGAAGWTGKISGVTNPAKVMGIDVASIAKVKGVA